MVPARPCRAFAFGWRVSKHMWLCGQVGEITSGAFSPCLKKNIAMGYVEKPYAKAGTELKVSSWFLERTCR